MCRNLKCAMTLVPLVSLIQSLMWILLSLAATLTYFCVLDVPPYDKSSDFFRVTIVKLYFEGPKRVLDGSYLGQFNQDYKNHNVIDLLGSDIVFAVMLVYLLLSVIQCFLSGAFFFYRKSESGQERMRLRDVVVGWSLLTLLQCVLDAFLTAGFVFDIIKMRDYLDEHNRVTYNEMLERIPYVPLVMALVSSRFIVLWIWNFVFSGLFFFNAVCCKGFSRVPPKVEKTAEPERKPSVKKEEKPKEPDAVTVMNGNYRSSFDVVTNPNFIDFKRSMEAVTRFNDLAERKSQYSGNSHRSFYPPSESAWQPSKQQIPEKWEMENEGFVSDEDGLERTSEKPQDFDHNLKNFEQGQRKIKIVKPPLGKPEEEV